MQHKLAKMKKSRVLAIRHLTEPEPTYDITVQDNSNYFASYTGNQVLVHNCKEFVMDKLFGPVRYHVKAQSLTPRIELVDSGLKTAIKVKLWTTILKHLYRNPQRMATIVKEAMRGLDEGHSIIIPVENNREACEKIAEAINHAWMDKTKSMDKIAAPFYAYNNPEHKKKVLDDTRSGKIRVVVGMRRMLLGVDVPPWSLLLGISPINNAPNFKQESKRVCTPLEGKPEPVIRLFVDINCEASFRCLEHTIEHCKQFNYSFPKKTLKKWTKFREKSGIGYARDDNSMTTFIGMPGRKLVL